MQSLQANLVAGRRHIYHCDMQAPEVPLCRLPSRAPQMKRKTHDHRCVGEGTKRVHSKRMRVTTTAKTDHSQPSSTKATSIRRHGRGAHSAWLYPTQFPAASTAHPPNSSSQVYAVPAHHPCSGSCILAAVSATAASRQPMCAPACSAARFFCTTCSRIRSEA